MPILFCSLQPCFPSHASLFHHTLTTPTTGKGAGEQRLLDAAAAHLVEARVGQVLGQLHIAPGILQLVKHGGPHKQEVALPESAGQAGEEATRKDVRKG